MEPKGFLPDFKNLGKLIKSHWPGPFPDEDERLTQERMVEEAVHDELGTDEDDEDDGDDGSDVDGDQGDGTPPDEEV